MPEQVMKQCTDAASDKLMNGNFGGGAQQGNCSQKNVEHVGNTMIVDSVCKFGSATTSSHAVITGSFDSGYTVDVTSSRQGAPTPGMPASGSTHMKIEAKWLGPCGAGERPGDMMMGNGMKMNIFDLQKMRGSMPQMHGAMPPPQR